MSKQEYRCPMCTEYIEDKADYIEHLRDEFEEHQGFADMAADELRDMGEEL